MQRSDLNLQSHVLNRRSKMGLQMTAAFAIAYKSKDCYKAEEARLCLKSLFQRSVLFLV